MISFQTIENLMPRHYSDFSFVNRKSYSKYFPLIRIVKLQTRRRDRDDSTITFKKAITLLLCPPPSY